MCPNELLATLTELREWHRITDAKYNFFRTRSLGGEARLVNLELYQGEQISSRRFNEIERAIERERVLEKAAKKSSLRRI